MAQGTESSPTFVGSVDWFMHLPESAHSRFFTETKWEETPVGALTTWSLELRLYVFQSFMDGRPVCLFWYDSLKQPVKNVTDSTQGSE